MTNPISAQRDTAFPQTGLWIALIAGLTVIGSFALACVAPMAAIAALAALTLRRTEGLILILAAWILNQAVGFVLLSYPHAPDTYGWGLAIGVGSLLGYFAATAALPTVKSPLAAALLAFVVAFVVYQLALFAYGLAVSYAGNSFSAAVVGEVLIINAVAYVGFLAIHRLAVALSLLKPVQTSTTASA